MLKGKKERNKLARLCQDLYYTSRDLAAAIASLKDGYSDHADACQFLYDSPAFQTWLAVQNIVKDELAIDEEVLTADEVTAKLEKQAVSLLKQVAAPGCLGTYGVGEFCQSCPWKEECLTEKHGGDRRKCFGCYYTTDNDCLGCSDKDDCRNARFAGDPGEPDPSRHPGA